MNLWVHCYYSYHCFLMYECWCVEHPKHQCQSVFSSSIRTSHLKAAIGRVPYWAFLNNWLFVRLFFRYCRILHTARCRFSFFKEDCLLKEKKCFPSNTKSSGISAIMSELGFSLAPKSSTTALKIPFTSYDMYRISDRRSNWNHHKL